VSELGELTADVPKTRGLNLNHHSALNEIFKSATTAVVAQLKAEPLHQNYQRLLVAGTKPNRAELTIARKIAAITLSIWKWKETYKPDGESPAQLKTRLTCGNTSPHAHAQTLPSLAQVLAA
jgi:hypothetical protein